jgi:hypothetical protein
VPYVADGGVRGSWIAHHSRPNIRGLASVMELLGDVLQVGEGICCFRTSDEAAESLRERGGGYARHARAAREIASEYSDSDGVLDRVVEEAMR